MAGPEDFLPPSFWAASISCLFLSSSSICFFFACASASFLSCSSFFLGKQFNSLLHQSQLLPHLFRQAVTNLSVEVLSDLFNLLTPESGRA